MSPTYAFDTATAPLSPAAVGSAWIAFFRPSPVRSPTSTHPSPDPDPLDTVVHDVPDSLPTNRPLSTSSRYIALPAFGAEGPRPGIKVSTSGKYPEPTITAVLSRTASSDPTAGSDHVNPTVFSAKEAVALRSPYRRSFPPGEPSATVNVAEYVGSKLS